MQITLNVQYKFNLNNHIPSALNHCAKQNNQARYVILPNYKQVDKSLVSFCGTKYKNPLDEFIGGYKKEKEFINNILIEQLNKKNQLPPSVLLAFPDDYTQLQVMQGIQQASDADFITIFSSDENLCDNLKKNIMTAREQFQKAGKQTVIIINDAEKAIGMTPVYAKELSLIPLSEEDYAYLKSSETNLKKVNFFKSLLDNVNNISSDYNNDKSPATIIFTTKKPQYIHPDLITRDGKMRTVIFPIPCGRNTKNSINFEVKKVKDKLPELVLNRENLSKNQIKQLEIMEKSNKLNNLSIDIENIPFQKIMNYATPNKKNGAFSNKKYQELALKSLKDYILQPKIPYSTHFIFNLASSKKYNKNKEMTNISCSTSHLNDNLISI